MENGTKLRLLYLYQHLIQNTDPENPESTVELMKMLKEKYDIKVSRNTISDDLAMLHDCDLHIEYYKSTQNKYYFDGQTYDLAELKVLIDAISSSKFITQRKSDDLITKLLTLTSADNAAKLRRHIYVSGRVKSDNEIGYYIVDAINDAIDTRRKISFRYTDFDVNRKRYITRDEYTVNPYAMIWDGDYYYLRGYCDERQEMRNFRLDRIAEQPKILNKIALMAPEGFTPAEYGKKVFRMFDTDESQQVQLFCHASMMKYLIDNFGSELETIPVDEEHFTANVMVCTSATFYRWIFGFGGKIKIVGPDRVKTEYREMLQKSLDEM